MMRDVKRPALLAVAAALMAAPAGAATVRLLFDLFFPRAAWLNSGFLAAGGALLAGLLAAAAQRRLTGGALHPFLPLLLGAGYLFLPGAAPVSGALLLGGGLWLALLLALPDETADRIHLVLLALLLLPIYLLTMGRTVGAADTFEFQVTVPRLGIVHPTGYPLYLLLGRLFVLFPAGSVAWRVNLASVAAALAAALLLFVTVRRLTGRSLPAYVSALALALAPTFWSQAVVAEVYALHAVFVAGTLYLAGRLLATLPETEPARSDRRMAGLLAWVGLGLTNHLTTLFLLPPAGLVLLRIFWSRLRARPVGRRAQRRQGTVNGALLGKLLLAFGLPLLLYLYLPLRWPVVNSGEPMGAARFVDWVVGGRFQDALQWQAWLRDPARYAVVGRLFLDEWGGPALPIAAALGWALFSLRRPWLGVLPALVWLGSSFYALNYYVPDLNVFLLPAQLAIAVALGLLAAEFGRRLPPAAAWLPATALLTLLLVRAPTTWPRVDQSGDDGLLAWGRAVLAQPLDENSLILADSEKIAPLYYLQQAEGLRPDLDIAVLFTEADYRARLGEAVASGQTVYLARFLPGLEGSFHLRSAGPLTEVGSAPLRSLPPGAAIPTDRRLAPLALVGLTIVPVAPYDPTAAALTFYWQAPEKVDETLLIYLRWGDEQGRALPGQPPPAGFLPANDTYPTRAWEPGEIVPDFHLLPRPLLDAGRTLTVQVALAAPFTPPDALVWTTITPLTVLPERTRAMDRPLRQQVGPVLLDGVTAPASIRPGGDLTFQLRGCGPVEGLTFRLEAAANLLPDAPLILARDVGCDPGNGFVVARTLPLIGADGVALPAGRYAVVATDVAAARCGWLRGLAAGCAIAEFEVSGVPLPAGAANFEDRIALLDIGPETTTLVPGGELPLSLRWQGLQRLEENYTVFLQVLDANDRIVGQVDSWPLQGTFPTSQWAPGEIVDDPYRIRLDTDLPPGEYRLIAGWYLLGTPLRRLAVVDAAGVAVDDKVTLPGFIVE